MSKPTFTPGPWMGYQESSSYYYIGGDEQDGSHLPTGKIGDIAYKDVCRVIKHADGPANARLIAAAPDMYAALEAIDNDWTEYHEAGPDSPELPLGRIAPKTISIWKQIRAALAKARGV